ncbi:MAG: TetR family transcriptional regulator [Alphaproteobacteria bacterium]|jgi:AcrR family transcriptional regulator|nr:TetR family transcriptional regulator [Alphaproteobacteria bacterium]
MRVKQHIKEYKRELILKNALELFSEKGFQKTTIDDIGGSLGVTKPFIYTYFDSKYSILEQLYDRAYRDLHTGILEILNAEEGGPAERLRRVVRLYVEENIERQKLTAIMLEEERNLAPKKRAEVRRKHREFDGKLTSLIEEGVAAGEFKVADPKLASLAISGMVRWMHRWYSPEGRLAPAELAARLSDLALNIVGCPAAEAMSADLTAASKRRSNGRVVGRAPS